MKETEMASLLTNTGAMVALQTLKSTNRNMATTQSQISTGLRVGSAKDNAATWAISKVMDSDVKGFGAIRESLALGSSTVNVARNAAETVTSLLIEIKEKIVLAQEENVDRGKIQTDISELRQQISSVVNAAQFNGLNLVNRDAAGSTTILSSLDRSGSGVTASSITVNFAQLGVFDADGDALGDDEGIQGRGVPTDPTDPDTAPIVVLADIDVNGTDDERADALAAIEGMIQQAIDASAAFGSVQKRIEIQSTFVSNLMDSMKTGIGALVDADMEEASARLQALQVQQQLGIQALSIANQQPQNILALFR
jgi:flagellin